MSQFELSKVLIVKKSSKVYLSYQIEADQSQSYDPASFKKLITEKFASETMPQMPLNYEKKQMLHWLQINRPSITDIFSREFFKIEKRFAL